jgi:hypothetical protein
MLVLFVTDINHDFASTSSVSASDCPDGPGLSRKLLASTPNSENKTPVYLIPGLLDQI